MRVKGITRPLSWVLAFGVLVCLAVFATQALFMLHFTPEILEHGRNYLAEVVNGRGDAPDQYRYLPYVVMALLASGLGFTAALWSLNAFSLIGSFLVFQYFCGRADGRMARHALIWVFALVFPLSMYHGPRGETPFYLLLVTLLSCVVFDRPKWFTGVNVLLAFSRADYAFVAALYRLVAVRRFDKLAVINLMLPIVIQLLLIYVLFPDASYYTDVVQLDHNLSLQALGQNPLTWLALAGFGLGLIQLLKYPPSATQVLLWAPFLLYLGFCAVVARLDEFRIYLPLLPLLYRAIAVDGDERRRVDNAGLDHRLIQG